jgi:hypothetical protein
MYHVHYTVTGQSTTCFALSFKHKERQKNDGQNKRERNKLMEGKIEETGKEEIRVMFFI